MGYNKLTDLDYRCLIHEDTSAVGAWPYHKPSLAASLVGVVLSGVKYHRGHRALGVYTNKLDPKRIPYMCGVSR